MSRGFVKIYVFIALFSFVGCVSVKNSAVTSATANSKYKLVWSDEFDIDGQPNQNNWDYEIGFVRNEEAQWYQKENAYCKNGKLIIVAKKETKVNPDFQSYNHKDFSKNRDSIKITSSCLITKGKHSWKYGRFEMRAKIPVEMGLWPAFWTLGLEHNWPANGEIDIMEFYKGKLLANIAWESKSKWEPVWSSKSFPLEGFNTKKWEDKFHVWRMDWDEKSIQLYVDDQLLNEVSLEKTFNGTNKNINPFHEPQYLLLNLAVGGINGGDYNKTHFPAKFIIDYVRVYQKGI